MRKKYIAPGLTVVMFRSERGYAASLPLEPVTQQIDLMLMMEAEGETYHNNIYDLETHETWHFRDNDESFWL